MEANMNRDFNEDKVRELLIKFPGLKIAFKAGLISRRLCRDVIGITKWEMDDLYTDLVKAGAIKVLSSSAFRATEDTMAVIATLSDDNSDKINILKED
jgi:hypothetical protein